MCRLEICLEDFKFDTHRPASHLHNGWHQSLVVRRRRLFNQYSRLGDTTTTVYTVSTIYYRSNVIRIGTCLIWIAPLKIAKSFNDGRFACHMGEHLRIGLDDVIVAQSDISYMNPESGDILYRGYSIDDLAKNATFEEVLYLLWNGNLPTEEEYNFFKENLTKERELPRYAYSIIRELDSAGKRPIEILGSIVATLKTDTNHNEVTRSNDKKAIRHQGLSVTAKMPTIVAAMKNIREGFKLAYPLNNRSHAANFLYMLKREEPDSVFVEALDIVLILLAEHGINASTFAGRIAASTRAELNFAVQSSIGTLSGHRHGGAAHDVINMLLDIEKTNNDPLEWIESALKNGRRIPGFGHRIYKVKDKRVIILSEISDKLANDLGEYKFHNYANKIEEYMLEEKNLNPNIDLYTAIIFHLMDVPTDLYTPLFSLSRIGGWVAHLLDQYQEKRIIRPRAQYIGPMKQDFVSLENR